MGDVKFRITGGRVLILDIYGDLLSIGVKSAVELSQLDIEIFVVEAVIIRGRLGQLSEIDNVRDRDDVAHVARGGRAADMRLDLGISAVIVGSQFNSARGNGDD